MQENWISVNEKLPSIGLDDCSETVLVTVEVNGEKRAVITDFLKDAGWSTGYMRDAKVVAWMPFPEPYMGD